MDDPSGELRRQRELVAAHLRWLDEQIARTCGSTPQPPPVPPAPSTVHVTQPPPAAAASPIAVDVSPDASAALPEIALPEIDPGSVRNEVRRGCFLYVIIVTVLLVASIAVAVWIGGQ